MSLFITGLHSYAALSEPGREVSRCGRPAAGRGGTPAAPAGGSSAFGARFPVAPDEPFELAEEVGIVVGAAGHGPVFGHCRPS